jgi:hypothetical protein
MTRISATIAFVAVSASLAGCGTARLAATPFYQLPTLDQLLVSDAVGAISPGTRLRPRSNAGNYDVAVQATASMDGCARYLLEAETVEAGRGFTGTPTFTSLFSPVCVPFTECHNQTSNDVFLTFSPKSGQEYRLQGRLRYEVRLQVSNYGNIYCGDLVRADVTPWTQFESSLTKVAYYVPENWQQDLNSPNDFEAIAGTPKSDFSDMTLGYPADNVWFAMASTTAPPYQVEFHFLTPIDAWRRSAESWTVL